MAPDGPGGLLGEVGNLQAVLVAARRGAQEQLQQGMVRAGQFDQLQVGGDPQQVADEQQQAKSQAGGNHAAGGRAAQQFGHPAQIGGGGGQAKDEHTGHGGQRE